MGSKGKSLILAKDGFIEWWGLRGPYKHMTIRMHYFSQFEQTEFINATIDKIVCDLKNYARKEREEIKDGR